MHFICICIAGESIIARKCFVNSFMQVTYQWTMVLGLLCDERDPHYSLRRRVVVIIAVTCVH